MNNKLNTEEFIIKEEWFNDYLKPEEKERLYEVLTIAFKNEDENLKIPSKDDREALMFYWFAKGFKARSRLVKQQCNKILLDEYSNC